MVVTGPVWAYGQPALFFQFLRHLPPRPLPPVQSKGFYFALCHCGQLILSWPCFQIAVSGQRPLGLPPPSPSSQPATCMCSLGFCSITLGAEEALGGSSSGPSEAVPAAPPGPPRSPSPHPPPAEAHLLGLAACANVGQGDSLTLILSLAQSYRADLWNFHLTISISGVYLFYLLPPSEASLTVSSAFQFLFPWCSISFECQDSQVT